MMAVPASEKDVWQRYSRNTENAVIEIREHRLYEFVLAAAVALLLPGFLALIFYINYGWFGWFQFLICLIAFGLVVYTSAYAVTLPRAIRFFPQEKIIEQSFVVGFLRLRRRRIDLSNARIQVFDVEYETNTAPLESAPINEPFTWKRHFAELWDQLIPIRPFLKLVKQGESKPVVKAFGLFCNPIGDRVLLVTEQRSDLDDLVQAWLDAREAIQAEL